MWVRLSFICLWVCAFKALVAADVPLDVDTDLKEKLDWRRPPPPEDNPGKYKPIRPDVDGQQQGAPKTGFVTVSHQCQLRAPSIEDWKNGRKEIFMNWFDTNWNNYLSNPLYKSFSQYMVNEYAPNSTRSSMFCDGLGKCGLADCTSIATDISQEDRQNALYMFEMMADIDHTYDIAPPKTSRTNKSASKRSGSLWVVKLFAMAAIALKKRDDIISTIDTGNSSYPINQVWANPYHMPSLSSFGHPVVRQVEARDISADISVDDGFSAVNAGLSLVTSILGLYNNVRNALKPDTNYFTNTKSEFSNVWNEMTHEAKKQATIDMTNLMAGDPTGGGFSLRDLVKSGDFLLPKTNLRVDMERLILRHYQAAAIGVLWRTTERSYIVEAWTENCIKDQRVPADVKICLPERPKKIYALYNISIRMEANKGRQQRVTTPKGTQKMNETPGEVYNITRDDVVRSSLYVWENKLENTMKHLTIPEIHKAHVAMLNQTDMKHLGSVPGAFQIPVCVTRGGEAISNIAANHAKNYPCICGNRPWDDRENDQGMTEKDFKEMERFLRRTTFGYSDDFATQCGRFNRCERDPTRPINYEFQGPNPPKVMVPNAYKRCRGHERLVSLYAPGIYPKPPKIPDTMQIPL
ncbi:hypothetical protein B0J11DRAFT_505670 [Dendryphion nanum]|uniref:Uncharacterized protein n=1 Tax=Dendryphion nanum TaxID=256645 RepID=A0A9P9DUS2_9PLEO|nr:hypothetical protein B0J11DRAFT_505670 [Dendryphion nanum]